MIPAPPPFDVAFGWVLDRVEDPNLGGPGFDPILALARLTQWCHESATTIRYDAHRTANRVRRIPREAQIDRAEAWEALHQRLSDAYAGASLLSPQPLRTLTY